MMHARRCANRAVRAEPHWSVPLAILLPLAGLTALSAAGEPVASHPKPLASASEGFDRDHDGRISVDEFYAAGPAPLYPRMKKVFDALDKEHRGSLSYAEAAQAMATVRGLSPKLAPEVDGALRPIPLEVSETTKRAVVRVVVNGVEGRFLLDTGLCDTIVDSAFARQAGVAFVEICMPIRRGNFGKKGDLISFVRVPGIEIADTHFRNFHAVMRDERGRPRSDLGEVDGVLGANLLFARPITLDFRRKQVSFAAGDSGRHAFTFDIVPNGNKAAPQAKFAGVHSPSAIVEAEIDGVKAPLLLDSGAAIGDAILVNEPYHAALRKLAGDPQAQQYTAKEVRVGGALLLANERCLFRSFAHTVIGSVFFERHVITVDMTAGKVWIDRNPSP